MTIEDEPRFLGGTGDLSSDDVRTLSAFVARNRDQLLANWFGEMSRDELIAALKDDNNK